MPDSKKLLLELEKAWSLRSQSGIFQQSQAVRIFYGPGDGTQELQDFAIDRFQDHYWVTEWESQGTQRGFSNPREVIVGFLKQRGALSVVGLGRPERGVAPEAEVWFGTPPESRFEIQELGARYWVQLLNTRHPGLFLDHAPLRKWLKENMKGLRVLNTFSYTGSLSVAAALGGAKKVTTLDLSKSSIQWAKENFTLNQFQENDHRFIFGDYFEWLPRLRKENESYDCIILDPPSFSHGKKDKFSTSKDLTRLHFLALDVLDRNGFLITSINSANVTWKKFETDLLKAVEMKKMSFQVLSQIDLPPSFPTRFGQSEDRYLKGWILKRNA